MVPLLILVGCGSHEADSQNPGEPVELVETVRMVSAEPAAFRVSITGAALTCQEDQLRVDAEYVGRASSVRAVVVADGSARVIDLDLGNPAPDKVFVPISAQQPGCVEGGTLAVIAEDAENVDCWVRGPEADDLLAGSFDAELGDDATTWETCRRF